MFRRIFDEGLAQASFLLACDRTREAVVIDPRRDIDVYVEHAAAHNLTIVHAIETHVHADFVSGARELASLGARVIGGPGSHLGYDFHEARHGERIAVGDLQLTLLHTPGHTPEHISILAEAPGEPHRLFSGDTLFVGAVGRPDLLGEELTRRLAGELHESLFNVILTLDDGVEIHPGHGAGSLCGAGIKADPFSTIGQERRFNPMLQHATKEAFVASVLADLPETPPYFKRMKRVNQEGPPLHTLARGVQPPPEIAAEAAHQEMARGTLLLDLRAADAFGLSHPRDAINIGFGSKLGYWAGWVIPGDARLILLTDSPTQALEARRQLLRVGLDHVVGTVDGGFEAWRRASLPVDAVEQRPASQLQGDRPRAFTVLDVRTNKEWQNGHLAGARHIPLGDLPHRLNELPRDQTIATLCEGGYRSSLAASLLQRHGFASIVNITGGMAAYRALETTT
jgi:hydroxyacylglutathione hydrolase